MDPQDYRFNQSIHYSIIFPLDNFFEIHRDLKNTLITCRFNLPHITLFLPHDSTFSKQRDRLKRDRNPSTLRPIFVH